MIETKVSFQTKLRTLTSSRMLCGGRALRMCAAMAYKREARTKPRTTQTAPGSKFSQEGWQKGAERAVGRQVDSSRSGRDVSTKGEPFRTHRLPLRGVPKNRYCAYQPFTYTLGQLLSPQSASYAEPRIDFVPSRDSYRASPSHIDTQDYNTDSTLEFLHVFYSVLSMSTATKYSCIRPIRTHYDT